MPKTKTTNHVSGLSHNLTPWACLVLQLWVYALCAQQWTQIADFPSTARDDGASFVIGNKAYCGTGLQTGFVASGDMHALDLDNESWMPVASLPPGEERQYACGFSALGMGFLFGGIRDNTYLNSLWMYDPSTNSWIAKAALPGPGRMGSSCFTLGDTTYIAGGRTVNTLSINELWAYSITSDTWHYKGALPFGARWRAAACSHQGKGYLAFGVDANNQYRRELYSFSPETQQWQTLTEFPLQGRAYVGMQSFGNDLLVVCGLDSSLNSYNDLWRYSPTTFSWQPLSTIPAIARRGGMVFTSVSALYYVTGIDENNVRLRESWRISEPTSAENLTIEPDIQLFPNPCEQLLEVKTPFIKAEFKIIDASGKCVMHGMLSQTSTDVDVSTLAKGCYVIRVCDQHAEVSRKIIKL